MNLCLDISHTSSVSMNNSEYTSVKGCTKYQSLLLGRYKFFFNTESLKYFFVLRVLKAFILIELNINRFIFRNTQLLRIYQFINGDRFK